MRISEAARRLDTSPRMLRYRESLGLLPPVRPGRLGHRQFTERDVQTVAAAFALERRFGIGPVALAFGLRVLTEPAVRVALADLGGRTGRLGRARALDFEQERALRMLGGVPRPSTTLRPGTLPQPATAPRPGTPAQPGTALQPGTAPHQPGRDATRSSQRPRFP